MPDGEGLFEVEPVEKRRPQMRAAAGGGGSGGSTRIRFCCCRRWTTGCPRDTSPGSSRTWSTRYSPLGPVLADCTEKRGYPPYDPRLMVRLLIYGCTTGVRSSRAIQRKYADDATFRSLAAGQAPDFRSIARFRRRHLNALTGLFTQSLHLGTKPGRVTMGHVALDGTKFEANASKHRR
ncbi:transposase [Streptomyces sp. TE33382]